MMKKKKGKRVKHIPQRTCVGCSKVTAKRALIRLVKTEQGIIIDPSGKQPGRGVYLHAEQHCWEAAIKGALARNLKVELTENDLVALRSYLSQLPADRKEGEE